ncbi:hypothetical protein E2K93_12475 [Thalassotalea sp. HSM 43]|uniref:hypothetical protein n=1 Tax=Thalassotalea sp. HSM 43 TaxID=2552945 RepID=UPI00107FE86E|nr:hypothetical protein [Thalassotalea sp. HSM 43]QBY05148.1 hypothetical protein E2K93_12475 [Thalassotalea sp. HSM 43]
MTTNSLSVNQQINNIAKSISTEWHSIMTGTQLVDVEDCERIFCVTALDVEIELSVNLISGYGDNPIISGSDLVLLSLLKDKLESMGLDASIQKPRCWTDDLKRKCELRRNPFATTC